MTYLKPQLIITLFLSLSLILPSTTIAQESEAVSGWSFGGVPAIAYNSDTGFQYGLILNIYNYGDGSRYPEYNHSTYLEWSRTTKGSGINKIFFDSKYLLPYDIRITSELSYLTEQLLPFYGFNGYESEYNADFEDDELIDDGYISRAYYRHAREITKLSADFQRQFLTDNTRWIAGLGYWKTVINTIDLDKLNEDQDEEDKLPDIPGLYDEYAADGYFSEDEAEGGNTNYIKLGIVFDTRDNEPNPMSGIWSEILVTTVPEFLGNDFNYTLITGTHRQYFTIIPQDLSFAYRLGYQGIVSGEIPFFMLPWYQSSYKTEEGLGGSKSLRGILKNRVVGNSVAFGNFELRWKFLRRQVFGQNLYLALNGFVDAGMVLDTYGSDTYNANFDPVKEESMHLSYGGGLRIALNENFIIAVDFGLAGDEQDGSSGLYIGLGYLY
jgi:outer membrane protein assembly factor BamA